MRVPYPVWLVLAAFAAVGCDGPRLPKGAIPASSTAEDKEAEQRLTGLPHLPRHRHRYQGRTAEEWARSLESKDLEEIWRAAQALHVLGGEGRPHLVRGLESASADTRRVCLENLTVPDLRAFGEHGQHLLVQLAGDHDDIRIRERASYYLQLWDRTIPAR
jgi:hypothetical protein